MYEIEWRPVEISLFLSYIFTKDTRELSDVI